MTAREKLSREFSERFECALEACFRFRPVDEALAIKILSHYADSVREGYIDLDAPLKRLEGETLLRLAAGHDLLKLFRRLVRMGADPNKTIVRDGQELSVAACAVAHGSLWCLTALAKMKVDFNAAKAARPLLHVAARRADESCVKILLEAGADPDRLDEDGRTALHSAVSDDVLQSPEAVTDLLAAGVDPLVRDRDGRRASDLCPLPEVREKLLAIEAEREMASQVGLAKARASAPARRIGL